MKLLVTAEQMRTCDSLTEEIFGVPSLVLMERAALAVAEEIEQHWKSGKILAVCGPGNNGGDGVAAARILKIRGYSAELFLTSSGSKFSEGMKKQLEIAEKYRIPIVKNPDFTEYTVIIDAVFGTGLKRNITGSTAEIIRQINSSQVPVIAVDIPSGIHADHGEILGIAVQAETTVTFAFGKPGLYLPPGNICAGKIITAEIGITDLTDSNDIHCYRTEANDLKKLLSRNPLGNKGTFGKLLIAAGSEKMCGAALLCAEASGRSGSGMVKVLTEESNRLPILLRLPDVMLSLYKGEEEISSAQMEQEAAWADLALLGPGMGTGKNAEKILDWFLRYSHLPLVLDADALNLAAHNPACLLKTSESVVITPHMGEMSRLTGKSVEELKRDPCREALNFAQKYGVVCVLKDARTVVASPEGRIYINTSGCSALATAGSGDVLAGLIASFLIQQRKSELSVSIDRTVAAAVFLHGLLGEKAAAGSTEAYVTAGDLIQILADSRAFIQ